MTRMKEIEWPQPTWRYAATRVDTPTRLVKQEDGTYTRIVLNRATRRRLARQNTTHLERLGAQEAMRDHVRHITRTGPTPKQARGRKARARRRAQALAARVVGL